MFAPTVSDNRFMTALGVGDSRKTDQSIGDNMTAGSNILCAPSGDLFLGESIDLNQLEKERMPFG